MRLKPTFEHPLRDRYLRAGGPWDVPCLDQLLGSESHDGIALLDGPVGLDHAQVDAAVGALARGLRQQGVGHGDVVVWQIPNWHEAVLLYRACWRLGAIGVPLHHRLGVAELAGVLETVEPVLRLAAPAHALSDFGPAITVRGGSGAFDELLVGPALPSTPVAGSDIAVGMLTSGSTGHAKIVLHSHRALAYKARLQQQVHALRADDVVLMPAPLSHVAGLINGVLLPGASGMRTVLMDVWDPEAALVLIEREKVTFMGGPAVFLTAMVESPGFDPARVRSLRVSSMGGSTMTPAALAELSDRLGCIVKRTYGATEAPTMTTMHAGDPEEKGRLTDGRAVGEAEVIVVDPADGTPREAGDVGEVWVRAPEMFAGYAAAAQTAEAVADGGWLRTGDLGLMDKEGWLTIAGRIKELIIRGGENIASAEVEALLEAHPSVRQAVAVGYPDRTLGERVAAVVVAKDDFDVEACRRWFTERGVAKFKTPELVVHVGAIPMLVTGKADRAKLKMYVSTILAGGLADGGDQPGSGRGAAPRR
jgi:acyl-CoA synthetase (AMP-forming)/AMP-acid ligase II